MAATTTDRLTEELQGQTIRVPELRPFFSRWPTKISPYYEQLKGIIESKIEKWIPNEHVNTRWYPRSSLGRLETMSWFSLWVFLWDDVIEATGTSTDSTLTTDVAWLHDEALSSTSSFSSGPARTQLVAGEAPIPDRLFQTAELKTL
ncbi:hypothetical protein B0T26DRAFT_875151 [Lasiosphaeria miniovina]|uniref:Uncharacterized protein n=1 Tax=Lasiosphaeria miniovina TaxID=1954250 RepID=A0AA40DP09_9PEZI|nr:uncharacterized protein B0T26DRAFT_875151 [Lasiosphaeria miniovina]KAK0710315.1 hypothetical protein B0T26DRAFT_875151 [Lasiosphaeria miniovina]